MGCNKSKNISNNIQCIEGIYIPNEINKIKIYIPDIKEGLVLSILNGDTIYIACNFFWDKYTAHKFKVRLAHIHTPRIKTRDKNEFKVGLIVKNYLEKLILNKKIILKNIKYDKYGQIIANINLPYKEDISKLLLNKRLAVYYYGDNNTIPNNWLDYFYYNKY